MRFVRVKRFGGPGIDTRLVDENNLPYNVVAIPDSRAINTSQINFQDAILFDAEHQRKARLQLDDEIYRSISPSLETHPPGVFSKSGDNPSLILSYLL